MKTSVKNIIYQTFIFWPTKFPYRSFFIAFTLIAICIPGLFKFDQEFDARMWFRTNDPLIKVLDEFEYKFGNDESIVIAYYNKNGIYGQKALEKIRAMTEQVWKLPQVIRVESLTNHNITLAVNDDINTEPLFDEERELTKEYIQERSSIALKSRRIPGFLVSENKKMTLIYARLIPSVVATPKYHIIYEEAKKLIHPFIDSDDEKIFLAGEAAISTAFRNISREDLQTIIPLLLLLIIGYLYFIFRSFIASLFPLIIMTSSVMMSLGIGFYFGIKFSNIIAILPIILIAISIADSVHILSYFFDHKVAGLSTLEASRASLRKNLIPTFLTSLSTSIGFFSLTTTDLMPIKHLGYLAGIGSLIAWLLSYFFMAGAMNLFNLKTPMLYTDKEVLTESISYRFAHFIWRHSWKVVGFFSILTIVSIYLSSKNIVNSDPYSYFKKGTIYHTSNDFIRQNFGGVSGPEFIVRTPGKGQIKEVEFLKKVDALEEWIKENPRVGNTISIVDIIKEVNQTFNNGDDDFFKIPLKRTTVAEYLFLYTLGLPQGSDLNNRMTLDQDAIRLSVLWNISDSVTWKLEVDKILKKAKEIGLDIEVTGKLNLYQRMIDYVVSTFFTSISISMILIALLLSIFFRSIKIGLLSMIPNILPLFYGGGFMYLMGFELNIGTALVASVCLGIAVDDTIHFLAKYHKLKQNDLSSIDAVIQIYLQTGKALIITSTILVSSFALYLLGSFVPNIYFGILCGFVLTAALAVDLIFLPALLFILSSEKKNVQK